MKKIIKKSVLILGLLSFSSVISFGARKVYVKREPRKTIATWKSKSAIRKAKSKKVYVKKEPKRKRR